MKLLQFIKGYKKITVFLFGALTVYLQDVIGLDPALVDQIVILCTGGVVGQGIADMKGN